MFIIYFYYKKVNCSHEIVYDYSLTLSGFLYKFKIIEVKIMKVKIIKKLLLIKFSKKIKKRNNLPLILQKLKLTNIIVKTAN